MDMQSTVEYLRAAIVLAQNNSTSGGRPFGAVVVRNGEIIATGVNTAVATHDPTAHAELNAIRAASQRLETTSLAGCEVYASGHPCPMCLAAMRLAGVKSVAYAFRHEDGAPYGLSTAALYADLARPLAEQAMPMRHVPVPEADASALYADWYSRQSLQQPS